MQISKPVNPRHLQSTVLELLPEGPASGSVIGRLRHYGRWWLDIDDGGGAVTCLAVVLAVFGTLFVRLVQLDRSLDSQTLSCKALDKATLQLQCKFE